MPADVFSLSPLASPLVRLHTDLAGGVTAQVPGIPELSVTAATRDQAVERLRLIVAEWLSSGQLVSLQIPTPTGPIKPPGWAKTDPLEQEFLEALSRKRQEDLEKTLHEYEQEDRGCSNSSSIPTT